MDIDILKRNISLAKLGITKLEGNEKKAYVFLVDNLSGLERYTSNRRLDDLFYGKSINNIVLIYHSNKKWLFVSYDKIWSFFEKELLINVDGVESIIKWWVKNTLDLNPKNIQWTYVRNYENVMELRES